MHVGALITQPAWLVSGTRIAGSFRCLRQAVIEERFGGFSGDKAVLGTLMHELVQVKHQSLHLHPPHASSTSFMALA